MGNKSIVGNLGSVVICQAQEGPRLLLGGRHEQVNYAFDSFYGETVSPRGYDISQVGHLLLVSVDLWMWILYILFWPKMFGVWIVYWMAGS